MRYSSVNPDTAVSIATSGAHAAAAAVTSIAASNATKNDRT